MQQKVKFLADIVREESMPFGAACRAARCSLLAHQKPFASCERYQVMPEVWLGPCRGLLWRLMTGGSRPTAI